MLPTMRTDSTVLPMSAVTKKSVVSRPRPLSLLAFGSRVAKRSPIAGLRTASGTRRIFVARIRSSTSVVRSPSKSSSSDNGADSRPVHGQAIVEAAIDLKLGDRAQAEADTEGRQAQQVAFQSRHRIEDLPLDLEPALKQNQTGADRFGVFGHERALLRRRDRRAADQARRDQQNRELSPQRHLSQSRCSGRAAGRIRSRTIVASAWIPSMILVRLTCPGDIE